LHRQVDEPLHLVVVVVFGLEIGRAIERTRIELRKRTEEALEAQENNLDAIGGGRS